MLGEWGGVPTISFPRAFWNARPTNRREYTRPTLPTPEDIASVPSGTFGGSLSDVTLKGGEASGGLRIFWQFQFFGPQRVEVAEVWTLGHANSDCHQMKDPRKWIRNMHDKWYRFPIRSGAEGSGRFRIIEGSKSPWGPGPKLLPRGCSVSIQGVIFAQRVRCR